MAVLIVQRHFLTCGARRSFEVVQSRPHEDGEYHSTAEREWNNNMSFFCWGVMVGFTDVVMKAQNGAHGGDSN